MNNTERIIMYLNNARLIVHDNLAFIYLMSEQQANVQRYSLGNGAFAASISLFAAINLISKIHYILIKGRTVYADQTAQDAYKRVSDTIKAQEELRWREVRRFMRKPRIGQINETAAFVQFIKSCSVDFGIDRSDNKEIERVWRSFRNKLTHIISVAGNQTSGQMLMTIDIRPSQPGMYLENLRFIRGRIGTYKPFDITEEDVKEAFEARQDIDAESLQYILKDKCHVERLTIAVDMALDWIIEALQAGQYSEGNCKAVVEWMSNELSVTNH